MKICVIGAGAIGGLIAARLAEQGEAVSVLARGRTLDAIQEHGIVVYEADPAGAPDAAVARREARVQASGDAAELGPQDVVVISVKYNAMIDIAASIGPLLGPETVVLSAMNGVPWWFMHGLAGAPASLQLDVVDPDGALSRAIPAARVIGCVVHLTASTKAPGQVQRRMGNRLILGEPDGSSSERLQDLAARLGRAGFAVEVSDKIQRVAWYKLWGNMTMNPISAITGADSQQILADPQLRDFMSAIMVEANEIGARLGLRIDEEPEARHKVTARLGPFKTSMLQDAQAGKPLEIDALVTVVRDLGRQLDIATPHTDALLGMVRVFARAQGLA